jgi:hypothetical protein
MDNDTTLTVHIKLGHVLCLKKYGRQSLKLMSDVKRMGLRFPNSKAEISACDMAIINSYRRDGISQSFYSGLICRHGN